MRLPESRVFFVVFSDWTTAFTQAHEVEQRKAFVCIHGMMVLFAWPRRAVIPEARRVAPQARGIDGESACQGTMSRAMDASGALYPCQTRGSPVVVRSDFSVWQSSDRCDVRDAFDALDPRRSPLSKLCDARRINLYPVGIKPKPRSLMQHCEGRGAPRKMGPIFRTACCSHAPGRSPSTLDWYVPLVSLQDSH